ncbi:uncharacterized protein LOC144665226 isoform X4 [Oculina patagonica]
MAIKQLFRIPVLLILSQMLYGIVAQQCIPEEVETSILGMMLRRHIYKRINGAALGDVCLYACIDDVICQSFNYVISQDMCELNNRTKEARPEDYVPDSDRYYFGRRMYRVPLGSRRDLPAETCKEIKLSEGDQAVSGEYWFDSIIPGETVLAHCDMKKEDLDECSASIPVCHANADCKNTRRSYRCSCKAGYTGNGKTCADIDECSASNPVCDASDIDECSASNPVCDANADCKNTPGSHVCSCKAGFTGDGKTCTDIDECSASNPVCDVNANCQNSDGSYSCSCKAGFTGDGKTCADIDECSASNPVCEVNANCKNTPGSHVCSCKAGFTGDGKTCTDIDECTASVPVCDVNANCQNTPGSHACSCKAGFSGDGKTCTDVDECSASISVCDVNSNCQNNAGSYICSCKAGYFGDGKTCTVVNKNCATLYKSGKRNSGVYTINPDGSGTFDVFCDQTTAGGGWTVFQKRQDGSVDFYLGWADYKRGFGNLNGEFWLGLEKIHRLTSSGQYKLRVDLEDFAGNTAYAEYGSFGVASEGNKYQLSMGSYSGTAGDSLAYHNGYPFTTKDQDNDSDSGNCALQFKGAWWYNSCHDSNLNGIYHHGQYFGTDSVTWYRWTPNNKYYESAKRAEMKIRPVNF